MCLKPVFSPGNDLEERLRLWRALQLCLALPLRHPENGIVTVGIDGLIGQALLPTEGKGMHDGQELPDIISAMNGTVMKHSIACLQVYRLIFHRTRIARTGRIHRPSIGPHFHWQGKYGIVAVCRWIDFLHDLHALRHFDTKQCHTTLDDLGHVLGQHQTDSLLLLVGLVKNRVVVVELVKYLCQFVAVVGDATG